MSVARTALVGLLAALFVTACGPDIPSATPVVASPGASSSELASPVEGVVIAVDASGLSDVRGFTLRTDGGVAFDFVIGQLEDPTSFPLGHLAEHQATSSPVRVWFRVENGQRVVYRLEDAED